MYCNYMRMYTFILTVYIGRYVKDVKVCLLIFMFVFLRMYARVNVPMCILIPKVSVKSVETYRYGWKDHGLGIRHVLQWHSKLDEEGEL